MRARKPQVNVSIEEETKRRWEEAIEESNKYSTLSDLVRLSVEREISGSDDTPEQTPGVGGKEVAQLTDRVDELENAISGIGRDFQELKGIIQSQTPSNQNLKSEAFAALPSGETASPLTPEEVADKIGGPVEPDTAEDVLDELATETGQVESIIGPEEGEISYRKKGDKL